MNENRFAFSKQGGHLERSEGSHALVVAHESLPA